MVRDGYIVIALVFEEEVMMLIYGYAPQSVRTLE